MSFTLEQASSQKGKTAIVTGANIGLGYETALGLAKKEARVVLACRNLEKAENARLKIMEQVPAAELEIMQIDLNSLASVRAFAKAYREKYTHLDLLINNAGIMVPPFGKTADGFESQMGINYFGHFLLTNLLFPLFLERADARVVSVSSLAHIGGRIRFDNLNSEKSYSKMGAYAQSKLACLLFAFELQRRIEQTDSPVISVAAHPGVSHTNLGQYFPKLLYKIAVPLATFFIHSPQKAALPLLYAALGIDVRGGDYFGPGGFGEIRGGATKVKARFHAHNEVVAKRLWAVSEELTGERFVL